MPRSRRCSIERFRWRPTDRIDDADTRPKSARRQARIGLSQLPSDMAEKITMQGVGTLHVPDNPIIPFIEGDGTGVDIWPATSSSSMLPAKYGKTIEWMEVLAGEKAFNETGDWLPQDLIDKFEEYLIGIKGPLTTPIGGGFRSLNVAIRQIMDLYVYLRPVRWFTSVPSPVKEPHLVDMVIFGRTPKTSTPVWRSRRARPRPSA